MKKLKLLDLFSGIGGFSLGLERSGLCETVAFCEIEPFPRKVLAKHWPGVKIYEDVRNLTAEQLASDGIAVDVICGGFPCQDVSTAGRGAGLAGERSGLWSEIARLVSELRPKFVIVENVSALLGRGLGKVLGDLASIGYDAEWHCIPASHVGAPHRRDRIWIVAYPNDTGLERCSEPRCSCQGKNGGPKQSCKRSCLEGAISNPDLHEQQFLCREQCASAQQSLFSVGGQDVANSTSNRQSESRQLVQRFTISLGGDWPTEPNVGRVANGVSDRVHRLKALGNAVVPQIPELIGRAILQTMEAP